MSEQLLCGDPQPRPHSCDETPRSGAFVLSGSEVTNTEGTLLLSLCGRGPLVRNHVNPGVRVYLWTLSSVPWSVCLSSRQQHPVLIEL